MNDLTDKPFGRLTVISRAPRPQNAKHQGAWWHCRCSCGETVQVAAQHLLSGGTRSCGCLKPQPKPHPLKTIYDEMITSAAEQGVRVCDDWRVSFKKFAEDVGAQPHPTLTLSRRDLGKNYTKGNCIWVAPIGFKLPQRLDKFYAKPPDNPPFVTSNMAEFRRKYNVPIQRIPVGRVVELRGWTFWRCADE